MKTKMKLVSAAVLLAALPLGAEAQERDLVIGMPIEPPNLDPTTAAPVAIREVTWLNLYEGLVQIDRNGEVQPLLAESWEVSEDGLTYSFQLREGVTFHDGTSFEASDVKFSFDRARSPESTNAQKQIFAPIAEIETPDDRTVIIRLSEPSGNFLYYLGWGDAVIVAPESAETNQTQPVGTGPFRFADWVRGDRVELTAYEDYWDAENIHLDKVTFRFINDAQAQVAALRAGDVHAFPNLGAPELFAELSGDERFAAVAGNTEGEIVAGLNNKRPPLDDVRVRQALMHGIDRSILIEGAYSGYGQPIGSHFSPNHPAYVDTTEVLPYDPERARELLAEAGHGSGLTLTIKTPQMAYASRSAELIAALLADIGVQLQIQPTEFPAQWIEEVFSNKDYDMTIVAHTEPLDIDIYQREGYYFQYEDEAFAALIEEAGRTTDQDARFELYAQAQRKLAEDVPALFLFQLPKLGVWDARLEGMWENTPIPSNVVRDVRWTE